MATQRTEDRMFIVKLMQLIWLLFGILEALIGLRVVLKLIAANPASPFAALVYNMSYLFVWPFTGLTRTPAAEGMVLEIPSIIAMFVYALMAWAVVKLIWILFDRPGETTVVTETRTVQQAAPPAATASKVVTSEYTQSKQG